MVQPRRVSPWPFLGVLVCLVMLVLASPRLWHNASFRPAGSDVGLAESNLPAVFGEPDGQAMEATSPDDQTDTLADSRPSDFVSEADVADAQSFDEPPAATEASAEGPEMVAPAAKIGTQTPEAQPPKKAEDLETCPVLVMPESIWRLPILVANTPSRITAIPHNDVQPSEKAFHPDTNQPNSLLETPARQRERIERSADDSWREPATLLESLNALAAAGPTSKWAAEVIRQIRALGPAVAGGSKESAAILDRLGDLDRQTIQLAQQIAERTLARKLRKAGYALGRRLDVWRDVVALGAPQPVANAAPDVDPHKLAMCLAEIDTLTGNSAEGQAWRNYLLVDALKQSSQRQPSPEDDTTRQVAQQVLARLTQTPLTLYQQQFVATGPVAALRTELRRWAAEPIGATVVLRDIEDYERTGLPSDARRLALNCQSLTVSSIEQRRQLADRVDLHYRNANLRIAVTEELLNTLIPERKMEYAHVDDRVLGRPTRGESLMATELAVRMLPDPRRVRMALEVKGEVVAKTTSDAGPARFHNDSESYYMARKAMEIDMKGVRLWPVEVGVENESRLTGVDTPLDSIPLIGSMGKWMAKSQMEQSKSAATREVKQKLASQVRERVNNEARQTLTDVVERLNQRVFDPLNSLSLDPQMIAAETTEKRFVMRLRVAGEDQLGSHTPRPEAPADSLASVQIHESVLNNGIQRLQLDGRKFTLPELSQHIATRLNRPAPWEINPDQADVKITFAEKDAVVVRCQEGQVVLTLSIAQLSKSPRRWKNFQIRAVYRPEVHGRSAQLVRDESIHLSGSRLNIASQIALRGIFSGALSKNNPWGLVPEQIVNEPKLSEAAITQFVIDDGWIGVALGPKRPTTTTARRPRWGS